MKLLRLLIHWSKFILKTCYPFLFLFVFFVSCEDKLPTRTLDESILSFSEQTLSGETLQIRKEKSRYKTGADGSLYFGENEDLKMISLLKFTDMNTLPDTLDEILELKLTLYSNKILPVDTTQENRNSVNIYLVKSPLIWSEDETTFDINNPLEFDNLEKELLTTYYIGEQDTCEVDLLGLSENIATFWMDSTNSESGIILEGGLQNMHNFQSIFSRNTGSMEPEINIRYVVAEDTTEKNYIPSDDLSIPINKNEGAERNFWSVSQTYNEVLLLNFDLHDLMSSPDSNVYIPEAKLKLRIDPEHTNNFSDKIYLYLSLLDTADYYEDYLYDISSAGNGVAVDVDDSLAVIPINDKIQDFISGYRENLGIVIWAAYSTNDMSVISFFDNEADPSRRPELKVLFAKEEK